MKCQGMYGRYLVLSTYVGNEEGTEPFLEGVFDTESEAQEFAASWNNLQVNQQFWVSPK